MEIDPSLHHVPKLAEIPANSSPIYSCQLCGRHGTLDELHQDECSKRSGVRVRMAMGSERESPRNAQPARFPGR